MSKMAALLGLLLISSTVFGGVTAKDLSEIDRLFADDMAKVKVGRNAVSDLVKALLNHGPNSEQVQDAEDEIYRLQMDPVMRSKLQDFDKLMKEDLRESSHQQQSPKQD